MKKMRKRFYAVFMLAILFVTMMNSGAAYANPVDYEDAEVELYGPDIHGEGYCVIDAKTGEIIISKNCNHEFFPASITKVMTALVVLENVEDLSDTLTFSEYAINSLTGNSSTLPPTAKIGEEMTVKDALYGMMLASANECSTALAEYVAGSEEKFAKMMNDKAKELGCVQTHFENAHGLHAAEHYTTPYEMLLIFRAALQNEMFRKIDTTVDYTMVETNMYGERYLRMGHAMVNGDEVGEGVYAGKTGRTYYAGRTLLTAAEHEGRDLLFCVMKSDDYNCYIDTRIMMEYAYGMTDGTLPETFQWRMEKEIVKAKENSTIREFPSREALSKGTLLGDTEITRLGTFGSWSMVECKSGNYYVASSLLEPTGEIIEPNTEESVTEIETETEEVTTEAQTEVITEPETAPAETIPAATAPVVDQRAENFVTRAENIFGNMSIHALTIMMLCSFGVSVVLLGTLITLLILWNRKK